MTHFADLIARLEKATGPDRNLDVDIFETQRPSHLSLPPHYTASIDDALTLVPEDAAWSLHDVGCEDYASADVFLDRSSFTARGETPAIALCIASLKARTTPLTQPGQDAEAK